MTQIEFSVIADTPEETQPLTELLKAFEEKTRHSVQLQTMKWSEAWPILLANALHGFGPAISHVGSTWNASIAAMNTLRPFSPQEVAKMGGPKSFFSCTWRSATLEGDPIIWSIPWTSYTYIVAYRSDRLERAGVDAETAFRTPGAMAETLARLQSLGIEYPWVIPTESFYADLIHIASSFIWGAGGDFISADGKHVLIHESRSCAGLMDFFELYRYLPSRAKGLTYPQCIRLFSEGRVGVFIAGPEVPLLLLADPDTAPAVRNHLQIALPPGIPWIGGDNLVIWRHVRGDPQQEQSALELISFLVSPDIQLAYSRAQNTLPTRPDVLDRLKLEPVSLKSAVETALSQGRPHRSIALWHVVENRLGQALNAIAAAMLENRGANLTQLIDQYIKPAARRLELTLEQ